MSANTLGHLHSIESFSTTDGPGPRCVVFLQGCALRCRYCHNPDTWEKGIGQTVTAEQLLRRVLRFRPYWRRGGGVTLSGGEPMVQSRFVEAFARELETAGVDLAIDTSGFILDSHAKEAIQRASLVILDIKHTDAEKHLWLTTKPLAPVLRTLDYLAEIRKPLWIRQVILPDFNDQPEDMDDLARLLEGRATVERVELLPFHNMAQAKWVALGIDYTLAAVESPSPEKMAALNNRLRSHGLPVVAATPFPRPPAMTQR